MINWILQLTLTLLEFASTSLCNVHRVNIDHIREIKSSKVFKSIFESDGTKSKTTKKMKGMISSKTPKISELPKNLKVKKGKKASKIQTKATKTPTKKNSVIVC